ncbi:ABC transporter permease [Sediminitomix flava]|uniref:Putative ABC transport system permease protein n=1 Tax=Sediminitomix flava TaxID=379075 RepID=A0A315Z5H2_SEDFL|nr:FtsX-like permease family protein [Sediminitomix flava]PWJ38449.1 putative ABC transport system permease protein [Sediminitomix flava]
MIKHSFLLLWARKQKNFMMILQLAFSFFLLFGVFTVLFDFYDNYKRPRGFDVENIMALYVDDTRLRVSSEDFDKDKMKSFESIDQLLLSLDEIEGFGGVDSSFPFAGSWNSESIDLDSGIGYQYTRQVMTIEAMSLLNLNFISGRNFNPSDFDKDSKSMIVNEYMYEEIKPYLNEKEELLFLDGSVRMRIVGVVEGFKKKNEFEDPLSIGFWPSNPENFRQPHILIKTKNDPRVIEAQLIRDLEKVSPDLAFVPRYFDDMKDSANKEVLMPLILLCVISLFLVINIALGLYGVLWYNISQRKSEIGLRRAVGADKTSITLQILSEVGALFTVAVFLGSIFAIQFPLLGIFNFTNSEYIVGALLSFIFVGVITIFCGYYPSKLASRITPVEALHEL